MALASLALSGCTAVQIASDKLTEKALNAVGVKLPESASAAKLPKPVNIRIETAKNLNAGEDGQGLSTIFRVYKLRSHHAFLSAPYSVFGHEDRERQMIGPDLVEVRELILSPAQTLELQELVNQDSAYLGVVAMFRTPAANRWRFAFAAGDSVRKGITLGLHACAMTATTATPVGVPSSESALLSPARCN